ncbi:GNAT family N-acetyltransferase [Algirhabdus cladophorae]|uniref:GNAT family N-acetyltransferase n=1 Tax=Algirhabdus cladophorae TaxID=3377108 RepID=UPI003B84B3CA
MNIAPSKGGFAARLTTAPVDIRAAQRLRHQAFRGGEGLDCDPYDEACVHLLVEDRADGRLLACARVKVIETQTDLQACYSAQRYNLANLADFGAPLLELGRFCALPHPKSTDILRTAWGHLTQTVDAKGIGLIFGCASFVGNNPELHAPVLQYLRSHSQGPAQLRILPKSTHATPLPLGPDAPREALGAMPPLLRSYLAMGGWVSDHAVRDYDLDTLHVFTALEVAKIPAARARALRAIAAAG